MEELYLPLPVVHSRSPKPTDWDRKKWCVWCDYNLGGSKWDFQGQCASCRGEYYFAQQLPTFPLYDPKLGLQLYKEMLEKENAGRESYIEEVKRFVTESSDKAKAIVAISDFNERKAKCKQEGSNILTSLFFAIREHERIVHGSESYVQLFNSRELFETFKDLKTAIEFALYEMEYPELLEFDMKWLAPELIEAAQLGKEKKDTKFFHSPHIYVRTIPFFSQDFCSLLVDEMRSIKSNIEFAPLDYKGLYLDKLGFAPFMKQLTEILNDAAHSIYSNVTLRFDVASVVFYDGKLQKKKPIFDYDFPEFDSRKGHPPHVDNSDITVNICLGDKFIGGNLTFSSKPKEIINPTENTFFRHVSRHGNRLTKNPIEEEENVVAQKIGTAIIHPGNIIHSSKPLQSGERFNLIVWLHADFEFSPWMDLPPEIQSHVLSFTSIKDLINLAQSNSYMHQLTKNETLWESFYNSNFTEEDLKKTAEFLKTPSKVALRGLPSNPNKEKQEDKKGKAKDPFWLAKFKESVELKKNLRTNVEQESMRGMMMKVARPAPVNLTEKKASFEPFFANIRQKQQNTTCYIQ